MQGFNMGRYMAPASLDPSLSHDHVGGFNKQNDTRPRAPDGSIVVRFEMPFKIWCSGCYPESIIDQGSRFNATKKSTGKFFTTPIYEFKMKHADCGKTIVIATDPLNQTYKMVSGGRRQDHDFKSMDEGGDVGDALDHSNPQDPFAAQEAARYAARKNDSATSDIEELQKLRERQWKHPHVINSQMRTYFRESEGGRWERDRHQQEGEAITNKFGLPFQVLASTKEDTELARNISFGQTAAQVSAAEESFAKSRSIFDNAPLKPLVRPAGMKDQAWNAYKQRHDLKQAAKIQTANKMEEQFGGWDRVRTRRKKRAPGELLSKMVERAVNRKKLGTEGVNMNASDRSKDEDRSKQAEQAAEKRPSLVPYDSEDE
ncbi:hypothetical protein Vi05172_g12275 [Venturia inaequalis]|uniref:DUF572-domain-containing protein n=1 Tax=Venturia inaequalis TaxID=5025 RepID=A0A8H3Z8V8_VENIN|nr:hypothetical protein EG327_002106 [Venturia inaequalis]RDI77709.1 hypothetical protein Vi05172_g12275 [Venturia inaequalis]